MLYGDYHVVWRLSQIDASCQAMSKVNADLTMTMVSFILRLR